MYSSFSSAESSSKPGGGRVGGAMSEVYRRLAPAVLVNSTAVKLASEEKKRKVRRRIDNELASGASQFQIIHMGELGLRLSADRFDGWKGAIATTRSPRAIKAIRTRWRRSRCQGSGP